MPSAITNPTALLIISFPHHHHVPTYRWLPRPKWSFATRMRYIGGTCPSWSLPVINDVILASDPMMRLAATVCSPLAPYVACAHEERHHQVQPPRRLSPTSCNLRTLALPGFIPGASLIQDHPTPSRHSQSSILVSVSRHECTARPP